MEKEIYNQVAFTLAEGGRRPLLNLCSRKCALNCHPTQYCHAELVSASITKVRRAAFTLAEVLITLAVIGIVAVVTIPTLVKKSQRACLGNGERRIFKTT